MLTRSVFPVPHNHIGVALSSLAASVPTTQNPSMEPARQRTLPLRGTLPLHPQDEVECRRCQVHCDKVVYPASCVDQACPFLYAFVEHGRTYVGCMQKVFEVEIDLELLQAAERRRGGFGAVKASRRPLPMCEVEVSSCYESKGDQLGCVNPEFFELPDGKPSFRVFARVPTDR
jgi:hypothetical protein